MCKVVHVHVHQVVFYSIVTWPTIRGQIGEFGCHVLPVVPNMAWMISPGRPFCFRTSPNEKVDVNTTDNDGHTAIILASWNSHLKVVRALSKHEKLAVNAKANDGATALISASGKCNLEVICELMTHKKLDLNAKNDDGATALTVASVKGHWIIVREFLKNDWVDVNAKSRAGRTAIIRCE